jgi:hypothetical protein
MVDTLHLGNGNSGVQVGLSAHSRANAKAAKVEAKHVGAIGNCAAAKSSVN